MLFDAHTRSFAAMGGIARRVHPRQHEDAVDKVKKGKGGTDNKRFAVTCAHYLFDADFCNVASGWEKGVEEKIRRPLTDAACSAPSSSLRAATGAIPCQRRRPTSSRRTRAAPAEAYRIALGTRRQQPGIALAPRDAGTPMRRLAVRGRSTAPVERDARR